MSEETKKTVEETPAEEPNTAPQAEPEAAPEETAAAPETDEAEKTDGKKKEGFFNKKARELEAVKAKLDAAEKNANQAKDQLLRMAAEYENYRKRSTREADQKFNDGISFAVNQIIPILDTLDMAANAPTTDENYKKGVSCRWRPSQPHHHSSRPRRESAALRASRRPPRSILPR